MPSLINATVMQIGIAAGAWVQPLNVLMFAEAEGPGQVALVHESEFALRFEMDAAPAGLTEDCARSGTAMITADPSMDPEVDVSPDGEAYASRDFMFEDDSPCMLSLRVELPPTRWLRLQEFRCAANDCTERGDWFLRAPVR